MNHIRQGQNNSKRSRGRGRKPQNSTNRAYDSNGPDVKIRGTATHICEKYQQLARDAISTGDRVMAENYYQHAEHYYRLIMAAQGQQEGQVRPPQSSLGYRPDEDQEEDDSGSDAQPQPYPQQGGGHYSQPNSGQHGNGGHNPRYSNETENASPPNAEEAVSAEDGPSSAPAAEENEAGDAPATEAPRRRQNRRRRPRHEAGADAPARSETASADNSGGEPVV